MSSIELLVEGVSTKFTNKFKAGSVQSNGKWYGVNKPVDMNIFQRGALVRVDIKTVEKDGKVYENIVGATAVGEAPVAVKAETVTGTRTVSVGRDFNAEARGKTLCALAEAALSSPYLAMAGSDDEFKSRADDLIQYFFLKIFPESK
jgi:hypothetical protein